MANKEELEKALSVTIDFVKHIPELLKDECSDYCLCDVGDSKVYRNLENFAWTNVGNEVTVSGEFKVTHEDLMDCDEMQQLFTQVGPELFWANVHENWPDLVQSDFDLVDFLNLPEAAKYFVDLIIDNEVPLELLTVDGNRIVISNPE